MAATQLIQVKVEPKFKKMLQKIADYKGISLSSFIKLILTKCAREEKKQIYTENGLTEEEELEVLKREKEMLDLYKNGKLKFKSAKEIIKELNA